MKKATKAAQKQKKTPKWLKALEAQSWQAELLISGLVITGLLQLPDFFIHWVEGFIIESSEIGFYFLDFAAMAILTAIDCLIILFTMHFLTRSLWIALLGLNSVFPEGINVHATNGMGPKYWKKAKEKYPDLSAYNQELDKWCSVIFSLAGMIAIVCVSISILVIIIYQVFRFLISFFPVVGEYIVPIGLGLYIFITLFAMGLQYLAKKYPDNKKLERFIDGYANVFGVLLSLYFFQKPVGYISSIFTSNVSSKKFTYVGIFIGFFLGMYVARHISTNPVLSNFGTEKYVTFNNKPHKFLPFNYENLRDPANRVFTPMIQADVITDNFVKLFIPIIPREESQSDVTILSFMEKWNNRKVTGFRDSVDRENLVKYVDFNQVFVNGVPYPDLDFQYYTYPGDNEFGLQTYIPVTDFNNGKNVLEIRKNYFSKKKVQKIVSIPFYFQRMED